MANIKVYSDDYNGFNQGISNSLWNVAIANAPYRTGNLRAQIKRIRNTQDEMSYFYFTALAPYIDFLEMGYGRVKRHKGFIEKKTVSEFVYELIGFIQDPRNLSFSGVPAITMRTDVARGYERKMLKQAGMNPNTRVNAFERATLGLMKEQNYRAGLYSTKRGAKGDMLRVPSAPLSPNVESAEIRNINTLTTRNKFL